MPSHPDNIEQVVSRLLPKARVLLVAIDSAPQKLSGWDVDRLCKVAGYTPDRMAHNLKIYADMTALDSYMAWVQELCPEIAYRSVKRMRNQGAVTGKGLD